MKNLKIAGVLMLAGLGATVACGSDDDGGGGSGGGTTGGSGGTTGGSGGTTGGSGGTTGGSGGATGGSAGTASGGAAGTASGGSAGAAPCVPGSTNGCYLCGQLPGQANACDIAPPDLCGWGDDPPTKSAEKFWALNDNCFCGPCHTDCAATCDAAEFPTPACIACSQAQCQADVAACDNDDGN